MTVRRKSLHLRLVENMEVDHQTGCWNWTGYLLPEGYAQFNISTREGWVRAHRKSFELFHGEIPKGAHVLHRCNNKKCVNPLHLYAGSNADNCADRVATGTQRSKTTYEQRVAIAISTLSVKELSEQYGLCHERVRVIKRKYQKGVLT